MCREGSADPRHDDQDQPTRARHVLLLPADRDGHLQLGGVLRRGGRGGEPVHVDSGRVLVGDRDDDDGRLRRHHAGRRLGQASRDSLRHRRRPNHRAARPRRRRQLQQLLPAREWAWLHQRMSQRSSTAHE